MRKNRLVKTILATLMVIIMGIPPMSSSVGATPNGFSDLPTTHWAHMDIMRLVERGVISGFPDGTYRPEEPVTREQFAALVIRLLEEPAEEDEFFDDVPLGQWSNRYVAAAVNRGIIFQRDYGDNLGANLPITRQEAAVWMVRALGIPVEEGTLVFNDRDEITHRNEVAVAVEIGLIVGMPGNLLSPAGPTTRAQAAVHIVRMSNILNALTIGSGEEIHHYV